MTTASDERRDRRRRPGCARELVVGRDRVADHVRRRPTRSSSSRPATSSRTTSRRWCSGSARIRRPRRTASTSIWPAIPRTIRRPSSSDSSRPAPPTSTSGRRTSPGSCSPIRRATSSACSSRVERHIGRGPIASIVVDAADPAALARFWVAASGWPVADESEGGVTLHNPRGLLPDLDFVPVDDVKSTKNRVHLDVAPYEGEDQAAEVARLLALGAEHVDIGQGPDVTWIVLGDPEGNEVCVLSPQGRPPDDHVRRTSRRPDLQRENVG